jgi:hypothetical protein
MLLQQSARRDLRDSSSSACAQEPLGNPEASRAVVAPALCPSDRGAVADKSIGVLVRNIDDGALGHSVGVSEVEGDTKQVVPAIEGAVEELLVGAPARSQSAVDDPGPDVVRSQRGRNRNR